jgi:hypothetical protein
VRVEIIQSAIQAEFERLVGPLGAAQINWGLDENALVEENSEIFRVVGKIEGTKENLKMFKGACTLTSAIARSPCRIDILED